jgi:aspartate/methionine/tyrosine aminotransferase
VIVVGDMSKALSMPALRLGWVIDADRDRRTRMVRARSYVAWSGSPILELLALYGLRHRDTILDRVTRVASRNREELRRFMIEVDDVLAWVVPRGGLVAFPWFRDGRDSRPFCERLAERGVLVAPGDCFGTPEHMRIGFGSQPAGIGPPLEILAEALRSG